MRPNKLSVIALLALASVSFAQDKKSLRLKINPGTTLVSTSVTDGKFFMDMGGGQEMKNKTTMVQAYKFDAGADGWLKFFIETTEFKTEGDDMSMGMGSDIDIAAAAKAVKITGEVNDTGNTRNVTLSGNDKLDMMSKQMMDGIADRMTQVGLMSMFFPTEDVGVGSKWSKDVDMAQSFKSIPFFTNVQGKAPIEFTLEAFETVDDHDTAKILVFTDGKVTFDVAMGGSGTGSMTLTSKGYVWIDTATGIPVKSETKMANNIDFGMGTMQQEITVNTSMKVNG